MIYPNFLKKGDSLGICAPSAGITNLLKQKRLDNAYRKWQELGFTITEQAHVRTCQNGRSTSIEKRVLEFQELITNPDIKAIICATGGDFLIEILPYIDWNLIAENPKWVQGYSDPTALLFVITTKLDIATIYSHNIGAFGMELWHSSIQDNIDILMGKSIIQQSFPKYEKKHIEYITGLESYQLDTETSWKTISNQDVDIEGRLLGGCLDILAELVGTPFDYVSSFQEKYQKDGIIWFFDNCELTNEELTRTLWKLKVCGWFQYTKAILFGRCIVDASSNQISFHQALVDSLEELPIPILYDMDFGHTNPKMTLINGGYVHLSSSQGKGTISFKYQ